MPENLEETQEVGRESPGKQSSLGRELLADMKSTFGSTSDGSAAAVEEDFGNFQLVDDSAPVKSARATDAPSPAPAAIDSKSPAMAAAEQLHNAMGGLGTDEAAVFRALEGKSKAEIDAIKEAYKQKFSKPGQPADLEADIRDEFSDNIVTGKELTKALNLLNGTNKAEGRNVSTELDEDGNIRRAISTDEDGLVSRDLQIPKGNTPLSEGLTEDVRPQDRFVEINNQRRPEETFNFENLGSEVDEDGDVQRVFAVDEDGITSREQTFG